MSLKICFPFNILVDSIWIIASCENPFSGLKEKAKDKVKADYIQELRSLNLLAGGGEVPALPQDPPMLDMSSRF